MTKLNEKLLSQLLEEVEPQTFVHIATEPLIKRVDYDRMKRVAIELAKHYEIMLDWIKRNHEMPTYSEMISDADETISRAKDIIGGE